MTPDRRRRIARTALQTGLPGLAVTLLAISRVLSDGNERWAPIAVSVLTVIVSAIHNLADQYADRSDPATR